MRLNPYVTESQGVLGWDRYAYADYNPIKYNDPSGHCVGPLLFACVVVANFIVDNAAVITGVTLAAAITLPWVSSDTSTEDIVNSPTTPDELMEHVSASLAIVDIGNGVLTVGNMGGATNISDDSTLPNNSLSVSSNGPNTASLQNSVAARNPSLSNSPDFIVSEGGDVIIVPQGATGTRPALNSKGFKFDGGSGGHGLGPRVTGVRIMDPMLPRGSSPGYPNGYVSYYNSTGQTVNPYTGQSNIQPNNPWWHIPLSDR